MLQFGLKQSLIMTLQYDLKATGLRQIDSSAATLQRNTPHRLLSQLIQLTLEVFLSPPLISIIDASIYIGYSTPTTRDSRRLRI